MLFPVVLFPGKLVLLMGVTLGSIEALVVFSVSTVLFGLGLALPLTAAGGGADADDVLYEDGDGDGDMDGDGLLVGDGEVWVTFAPFYEVFNTSSLLP